MNWYEESQTGSMTPQIYNSKQSAREKAYLSVCIVGTTEALEGCTVVKQSSAE